MGGEVGEDVKVELGWSPLNGGLVVGNTSQNARKIRFGIFNNLPKCT